MIIFADASNSDVITWGIIVMLTTIGANIATILATRRVQKREVSFEFTPASKEEFDAHVLSTNGKFDRLAAQRDLDLEKAGKARSAMHQDIGELGEKISALTATTESQNKQLDRMDKKIDEMPHTMIATLRNTGALGGSR